MDSKTRDYIIENFTKKTNMEMIKELKITEYKFHNAVYELKSKGLIPDNKKREGSTRRQIQQKKYLEVGKEYKIKGLVEGKKSRTIRKLKVIEEYPNLYLCLDESGRKDSISKVDLYTKELEVV